MNKLHKEKTASSSILGSAARGLTGIIVVVLLSVLLVISVAAMDFSVRPELPENQREGTNNFFDLLVQPGQKQELVIEVSNPTAAEIVVLVETITATTSRNGQINYTSRGEADETMKYSFEDLVDSYESYYTIPAESSVQVPISLTIPDEPFEGAMLGSIRVLREATQEERDAAGAIVNQYAHVTAVRLVQTPDAENIPADFVLGDITAELVNYKASIIAQIRNVQPRIIKEASATARIYMKGSDEVIFEHSMETLEFAPNSVFPYSFIDREGYGIDAGDYTAIIELKHEDRTWNFEQDFTILPQVAAEVNDGAVNQTGQQRPSAASSGDGVPMWAMVAIGVGAGFIAAVVILIVVVKRKPPFPQAS